MGNPDKDKKGTPGADDDPGAESPTVGDTLDADRTTMVFPPEIPDFLRGDSGEIRRDLPGGGLFSPPDGTGSGGRGVLSAHEMSSMPPSSGAPSSAPPPAPPSALKSAPLLAEFHHLILDGRTFHEHVETMDEFFREGAYPHYWSQFELMRRYSVLAGLPGGEEFAGILASDPPAAKEDDLSHGGEDEETDLGAEFDIMEAVRGRIKVGSAIAERFDIKYVLRNIHREALFSSRPPQEHEEAEEAKRKLWETVQQQWTTICRDPSSKYFFTGVLGFGNGSFGPDTALKCPRVLKAADLPSLGVDPQTDDEYLAEILRFRTLFLLITRKAFDSESPDDHRTIPYYRVGYLFAQIAALLSEKLGKRLNGTQRDIRSNIPNVENKPYANKTTATRERMRDGTVCSMDEFCVYAPSLLLFPEGTDPSVVDSYIKCNLSLIFPDNSKRGGDSFGTGRSACCVQEDFITMDLMILADRFGLLEKEEYKKVFNALHLYRKMQYIKHFHYDPDSSRDPDKTRRSLMDLLHRMSYKRQGRQISVASLGHGDMVLENLMMETGKVSKISAVDIDIHAKFDETEERVSHDGLVKETIVGVLDKVERSPGADDQSAVQDGHIYKESPDVRKKIMDSLDTSDLVVAGDVLHETSDPYAYVRDLWDKVAPGGILYITEPVHCQVVDQITDESVNHYDRTRWAASMLPLEDYFNIVAFLKIMGANIKAIGVVPGTFAGANDSYSRISIVLKKPADVQRKPGEYRGIDYELPYERSPEEWDQKLERVEDIFKVWPLSTIEDPKQRDRLLDTLNNNVRTCSMGELQTQGFGYNKNGEFNMKYGDVKREVIKWLIPLWEVYGYVADQGWHLDPGRAQCKAYERHTSAAMPYPIEKIEKSFGPLPKEILSKNHLAGEVRALEHLLRTSGYNGGTSAATVSTGDAGSSIEPLGVRAVLGQGWGGGL